MAISKLHRANSGYSFVRDKKFRSCRFTFDHCYTIFVNFTLLHLFRLFQFFLNKISRYVCTYTRERIYS